MMKEEERTEEGGAMTLLERLHIRHEAPQDATETVERIPESKEVVTHGRRMTEDASTGRATKGVRWLRLTAVLALLAGAALVVTMLVSDGETDEAVEWTTVQEGPGSNSLGSTEALATQTDAVPSTADGTEARIEATTQLSSYELVQRSIDEAIAELEANSQNELASVITPLLDDMIAELEANSQNELASVITPLLDDMIAELEANSQNELASVITPLLDDMIAELEANSQNEL